MGNYAIVFTLAVMCAAVWAQEESDSPYTLSDFSGIKNPTNEKKLPDLAKPGVRKQLTCSVCRAVVGDFREAMLERQQHREEIAAAEEAKRIANGGAPSKKRKRVRVTELDVAEVTDGFCQRVAKEYNLMTLDNKPGFKDGERRSDHGYWVSQFFELRCSELLEQREEEMVRYFAEVPDQFLARICNDCKWKLDTAEHPDTSKIDPSQLSEKVEL
uniref:DUF3456 domain-containing protein n=1 Tax=Neobodo designis TaxID=312471 RepID=A0A7S1MJ50_NEODS|mmetsp:Transcript_41635/g.128620  ORF Transcript_41635/g.128620 Transcript_41635/m.128620 type:complete len:215 (+) Transcript_41635:55-699(+)